MQGALGEENVDLVRCPTCDQVDWTKQNRVSAPGGFGVEVTAHLYREPSEQNRMDRIFEALIGGGRGGADALVLEQSAIASTFLDLCDMVLKKNRRYGGAALNPTRVFSDLDSEATIRVRLDDKISRIRAGAADDDEDPIADLVGYLVLLLVGKRRKRAEDREPPF